MLARAPDVSKRLAPHRSGCGQRPPANGTSYAVVGMCSGREAGSKEAGKRGWAGRTSCCSRSLRCWSICWARRWACFAESASSSARRAALSLSASPPSCRATATNCAFFCTSSCGAPTRQVQGSIKDDVIQDGVPREIVSFSAPTRNSSKHSTSVWVVPDGERNNDVDQTCCSAAAACVGLHAGTQRIQHTGLSYSYST